jgi:ABC-type polysaccharide/polyol phosphate transport system ATPase subunit
MNNNTAVQINNLSKSFYIPSQKRNTLIEYFSNPSDVFSQNNLKVLDNISVNIEKGQTLAIMGDNGSGKSTLLKIIAGIYEPDEGNVKVHGNLVPFLELGVGFHPELTAYENIYLNGIILGMTKDYIRSKFDEIVDFAEIRDFLNLPLKNFSSGMQVRLAFSIAFTSKADIYVLDEVFAVGDIHFQEKSKAVFEKLKNNGKTIIFVSHSPELVRSFCSRAILLKNGIIVKDGKPEEVITHYFNS